MFDWCSALSKVALISDYPLIAERNLELLTFSPNLKPQIGGDAPVGRKLPLPLCPHYFYSLGKSIVENRMSGSQSVLGLQKGH